MITLGIDIGKHFGFAVANNGAPIHTEEMKFVSLWDLERKVIALIRLWKPQVVLLCESRCASLTNASTHGGYAAIVEMACQKCEVPFVARPDNTMRKTVFGKGNKSKEEIRLHFQTETDHESDAMVAAVYGHQLSIA